MEREVRREKLQKMFAVFDTNGDGRIDRAEFGELLLELGATLTANEADAAFADIDRDGSGAIDVDELATWWRFPFR
jgi:calcium-binding protein CML